MKKGVFLALLLMLLAAFPALAEDVYYADASQGGSVTSDKGYLSVSCIPDNKLYQKGASPGTAELLLLTVH